MRTRKLSLWVVGAALNLLWIGALVLLAVWGFNRIRGRR